MKDIKSLREFGLELNILYVEDEEQLRKSLARYLEKIFKTVTLAKDGQEGLKLYKQNSGFDIVITDIRMPNMDGLAMANEIKKINKDQNIIVVSAYSDVHNFMQSISLGIDGYILKPVDFDQMNEVLYKVMFNIHEVNLNRYYQKHLKDLVDIKTKESKELFSQNIENYKQTLYGLVELIEQRDTYTGGHSQRVAQYSKMLASSMGFDKKQCEEIYEAGMLHDIGKIAIPDSILLNPSKLNDSEYKLIQSHVEIGYDMLQKVTMFKNISSTVASHHERYDGSGYPKGLKGEQIPISGRIMAVADSFDAMTTSRIYKKKKSITEAIDEIKSFSGTLFCPDVVKYVDILSNVTLDENISQLPTTKLEQERFSYFYKDQISDVFNRNYLNLVLAKNNYSNHYKFYNKILLKGFSKYNEKNGWDQGDILLKKLGNFLQSVYKTEEIFRVDGDDFIILSKNEFDFQKEKILKFAKDEDINIEFEVLGIVDTKLKSYK